MGIIHEAYLNTYYRDATGRIDYGRYLADQKGAWDPSRYKPAEPPPTHNIKPLPTPTPNPDAAAMAEAMRVNAAFDRETGRIDAFKLKQMRDAAGIRDSIPRTTPTPTPASTPNNSFQEGFTGYRSKVNSSNPAVRVANPGGSPIANSPPSAGSPRGGLPGGMPGASPRGGFGGGVAQAAASAAGNAVINSRAFEDGMFSVSNGLRKFFGKPPLTREQWDSVRKQAGSGAKGNIDVPPELREGGIPNPRKSNAEPETGKRYQFVDGVRATFYSPNNFRVLQFDVVEFEIRSHPDNSNPDYRYSFQFRGLPEKDINGNFNQYETFTQGNGPNIDPSTLSLEPFRREVPIPPELQRNSAPDLQPPPIPIGVIAPPPPEPRVAPPPATNLQPPPGVSPSPTPSPPPGTFPDPRPSTAPPPSLVAPPPGTRISYEPPGSGSKNEGSSSSGSSNSSGSNSSNSSGSSSKITGATATTLVGSRLGAPGEKGTSKLTTELVKPGTGELKPPKIQEIEDKQEKRVEIDKSTNQRCQLDPCIANVQKNQENEGNKTRMVSVTFNKFVSWNALTGRAVHIPQTIQVPENMVPFVKVMGDRTADIRARHGLAEFRARLTQVMNTISTAATLHNAAMLSANLGQTLGDVVTESVQTFAPMFGVDKEVAEAFNFNEVLGNAVNETLERALGKAVWEGTKSTFVKLNRVITTASNIAWTVQSIGDSARSIAEFTAENTGKIGNALKKWRVVGENAYEWMPEDITARTATQRKLDKAIEGIGSVDDTVSSIGSVVSDVKSIGDEVNELKEQRNEFKQAIEELEPKRNSDNKPIAKEESEKKEGSTAPSITKEDKEQGADE